MYCIVLYCIVFVFIFIFVYVYVYETAVTYNDVHAIPI